MSSLPYKNILIGVSGGIAAYKIPLLVRALKKRGHCVKVVLTPSAEPLVGLDALKTVSGNPVYRDIVDESHDMGHIRLEEWADLYVVVPATANTVGKIAHGIADNLLTTLVLSVSSPVVIVPAMNTNMWENAAVVDNVALLKSRGVTVLPVGSGELACGVVGAGRMLEPEDIVEYIPLVNKVPDLSGKSVLITTGPTSEPIDDVRVITNSSTGKMGAALARCALLSGAERILVVSGNAKVSLPEGVEVISVTTAREMYSAVEANLAGVDVFVMAAAVSDYRVSNRVGGKIDRHKSGVVRLELEKNPDIAAMVGVKKSSGQKLVTFSLEADGDLDRAREKMVRKRADFTVFNRVDTSLGTATTSMTILGAGGGEASFEGVTKAFAASEIFKAVISG